MDRLKLGALGERLKTGGAQMSRRVSGKMKEILQVQTPEAKMVDDATSENLKEAYWGLNLRICALLNSGEFSGPEVVRAIKKKMASKSTPSQRLSLDLLETCAMNCEKVFSEIASEKVLDEMVRMIDNPQTHYSNRQRALQLIQAWGESEDLGYLPVFQQTYMSLKARGIPFSMLNGGNLESTFSATESGFDHHEMPLPERFPNSDMGLHAGDQIPLLHSGDQIPLLHSGDQIPLAYHRLITPEERKEILAVARNSIELLNSMVDPETQEKPIKDDLILSMLEKCKQSQLVIQRIIENAGEDEGLLFEALNVHDELQQVLSKYAETDAVAPTDGQSQDSSPGKSSGSSGHLTAGKETTEKEAEKKTSPVGENSEPGNNIETHD